MNTVIILCGGRGRRMGQDKGLMLFNDKPLILHVLETASEVADEIIMVLRDSEQLREYKSMLKEYNFSKKNLIICIDPIKDQGPLMGIYSGLKNTGSNRALVVPCDSPFISKNFIENIFNIVEDKFDAIVPKWSDGRIEPLHAIYNKNIVSKIENIINDKRDVKSLLNILKVKYIEVHTLDTSTRSFWNLNNPDDLNKSLKFQ